MCSSFDGHGEEDGLRGEEADGYVRTNGGDYGLKKGGIITNRLPPWLSSATPDEFLVRLFQSIFTMTFFFESIMLIF